MGARLTDSAQYAHLWGTAELRAVFDDRARLQSWLDILAALATAQARLGIIPVDAAEEIRRHARADLLDMDYVVEQTRLTSHSTLGLIRAWQRILPDSARDACIRGAVRT
jgi:adenylosuccinate lyase